MKSLFDPSSEERTIESWVTYCREHGMYAKGKEFLLLLDFAGGGMSEEFYRNHAEEALATLDSIDQHKQGAAAIIDKLRPLIESRVV